MSTPLSPPGMISTPKDPLASGVLEDSRIVVGERETDQQRVEKILEVLSFRLVVRRFDKEELEVLKAARRLLRTGRVLLAANNAAYMHDISHHALQGVEKHSQVAGPVAVIDVALSSIDSDQPFLNSAQLPNIASLTDRQEVILQSLLYIKPDPLVQYTLNTPKPYQSAIVNTAHTTPNIPDTLDISNLYSQFLERSWTKCYIFWGWAASRLARASQVLAAWEIREQVNQLYTAKSLSTLLTTLVRSRYRCMSSRIFLRKFRNTRRRRRLFLGQGCDGTMLSQIHPGGLGVSRCFHPGALA